MARIRTIKPEFFTSLTIADLPLTARLTFIGLWTHVDDEGRCVDEPRLIRAAVWPLDDRLASDVEDDLRALHDASLILRYEHAGRRYLAIRSWDEHQRIDKPKTSKHPAPEEGTPTPPTPPNGTGATHPTSTNAEILDTSETHPGRVPDASTTHPGTVPVGTGNREGNREGNRNPPTPHAPDTPDNPAAVETGRALPDRMADAFLERYSRGNAYNRRQIRRTIADTLANDTSPDELWDALQRLGDLSKPISAGTLQFAFSDIRKANLPAVAGSNVVALPGGQQLTGTDARVAGWAALAARLENQGGPQ